MPKSKNIAVNKTARYFTSGNNSNDVQNVWFVCHGYGQLAENFIKNFEILDLEKNFIIAPEGLNRFYFNGFSGRIGASWMTKEAREDEIKDYINFLDSVYENEIKNFDMDKVRINVLGFSQGASTVCRWLLNKKSNADNLIIWAGDIPPDSDPESIISVFKNVNIYFVVGDNDEFLNTERIQAEKDKIEKLDLDYNFIQFKGKHTIDSKTLLDLSNTLH